MYEKCISIATWMKSWEMKAANQRNIGTISQSKGQQWDSFLGSEGESICWCEFVSRCGHNHHKSVNKYRSISKVCCPLLHKSPTRTTSVVCNALLTPVLQTLDVVPQPSGLPGTKQACQNGGNVSYIIPTTYSTCQDNFTHDSQCLWWRGKEA